MRQDEGMQGGGLETVGKNGCTTAFGLPALVLATVRLEARSALPLPLPPLEIATKESFQPPFAIRGITKRET